MIQIAKGIEYLHDEKRNIVHRDLKPENIMIHNGIAKIGDFGNAKIMMLK